MALARYFKENNEREKMAVVLHRVKIMKDEIESM